MPRFVRMLCLIGSALLLAPAAGAATAPISRDELPMITAPRPRVPAGQAYLPEDSSFASLAEIEDDAGERAALRKDGFVAFFGRRWRSADTFVYVVAVLFRDAAGAHAAMARARADARTSKEQPRPRIAPAHRLGDEGFFLEIGPYQRVRISGYFWRHRNVLLSVSFGRRDGSVPKADVRSFAAALQSRARSAS